MSTFDSSPIPAARGLTRDFSSCIVISVDPSLTDTSITPSLQPVRIPGTTDKIYVSSPLPPAGVQSENFNHFLASANEAFDKHIGFVLAPQHLFMLILQQVSMHVNRHPEEVRKHFVNHTGQIDLKVERGFNPNTEAEWESVIDEFKSQIAGHTVGDTSEICSLKEFSVATGPEIVSSTVCLMDMCQKFFRYTMTTMCGIPSFILEGSIEDWVLLREKAERLISQKTLPELSSKWIPALLPTLDKLIEARSGAPVDVPFWNSFFKRGAHRGSGGYSFITGWVNVFFPIRVSGDFNQFCEPFDQSEFYQSKVRRQDGQDLHEPKKKKSSILQMDEDNGQDVAKFPVGISRAPVLWKMLDTGENINLEFSSGFVCGTFSEGHLRPEVAWWVGNPVSRKLNSLCQKEC